MGVVLTYSYVTDFGKHKAANRVLELKSYNFGGCGGVFQLQLLNEKVQTLTRDAPSRIQQKKVGRVVVFYV